jgi:hypothetical protein
MQRLRAMYVSTVSWVLESRAGSVSECKSQYGEETVKRKELLTCMYQYIHIYTHTYLHARLYAQNRMICFTISTETTSANELHTQVWSAWSCTFVCYSMVSLINRTTMKSNNMQLMRIYKPIIWYATMATVTSYVTLTTHLLAVKNTEHFRQPSTYYRMLPVHITAENNEPYI